MQIAQFTVDGDRSWGFVRENTLSVVGDGRSLGEALADHVDFGDLANRTSPTAGLEDVELLAPITNPPQFIGVGMNYGEHAVEAGVEIPDTPLTFPFYASAIANPGEPIVLPPFTNEVDWEVELGVVIGRSGRNIAPEHVLDHVAGYTIVHDVSARDIQMSEGQWSRAKSFDSFKPMGPWMTTADELGAADHLAIRLSVNGQLKQSSNTDDLIFDVPTLVSFLSSSFTLQAGTVISTGTPSGVGFARKPAEYLRPGDTVSLEIEGIGILTNPVVAGAAIPY